VQCVNCTVNYLYNSTHAKFCKIFLKMIYCKKNISQLISFLQIFYSKISRTKKAKLKDIKVLNDFSSLKIRDKLYVHQCVKQNYCAQYTVQYILIINGSFILFQL
jgi:hypothetical protein